jgi:hypothetical protein
VDTFIVFEVIVRLAEGAAEVEGVDDATGDGNVGRNGHAAAGCVQIIFLAANEAVT